LEFQIHETEEVLDQLYGPSKKGYGFEVNMGPQPPKENEHEECFINIGGEWQSLPLMGTTPGPPVNPALLSAVDFTKLAPQFYACREEDIDR
jgi:hypothetical protein